MTETSATYKIKQRGRPKSPTKRIPIPLTLVPAVEEMIQVYRKTLKIARMTEKVIWI
ncbi:MAG: hypothetical protein VSS75_012745 [Candidatus Parabeggiatoa sp.]|nr:hypothetical protein [Candidatus Parabeggiatoa sp.]